MSTEFKWDDEKVLEFVRFTLDQSSTFQGRYTDLKQFKESKQPKPLFTTLDLKDIFNGERFYYVDKSFKINDYWADNAWTPREDGLEFSTKEAAEEYILYNKPTISLSQVLLRYSLIFGKNDEFSESMKNIALKALTPKTGSDE